MQFVNGKLRGYIEIILQFWKLDKIKNILGKEKNPIFRFQTDVMYAFTYNHGFNESEYEGDRLNSERLYYAYFGLIPNRKVINFIDFTKLIECLESKYANQITKVHKREKNRLADKEFSIRELICVLKSDILIYLDSNGVLIINYNQNNTEEAQKIALDLLSYKLQPKKRNYINLVIASKNGLSKKRIEVDKPKMKLRTHYNDELVLLHWHIIKKLRKEKESGLFLFHGQPGTGKSTYIRHLIYSVKKNVIFISPRIAGNLDSPDFTEFLINNPNSILVIEDAENLIMSRDSENNSAISMILNLTDGLLGEGLGIQFICTFNTHLSRIDKALLRKGRLKALYEFGALSVDKSNYLLKSLNLEYETNKPMTLAEIYNLKEEGFDFEGDRRVVGFAA